MAQAFLLYLSDIVDSERQMKRVPVLLKHLVSGGRQNLLWFEGETSPHGLMCLNTWSPSGSAVWDAEEPSRGRVLLKEVRHCRRAWRFYSLAPLPIFSASGCWWAVVGLHHTPANVPSPA